MNQPSENDMSLLEVVQHLLQQTVSNSVSDEMTIGGLFTTFPYTNILALNKLVEDIVLDKVVMICHRRATRLVVDLSGISI